MSSVFRKGKKRVFVVDGLFTSPAIAKLFKATSHSKAGKRINAILTDLNVEDFAALDQKASKLLRRHFPRAARNHWLTNVTVSRITARSLPTLHRDFRYCPDCVTCLYYGNPLWESGWGGETIFYDDTGNAEFCTSPKPGRLVFFNDVLHRASLPTAAPVSRITLNLAYRCQSSHEAEAYRELSQSIRRGKK